MSATAAVFADTVPSGRYSFGISAASSAAELRRLAGEVERGEVVITKVTVISRADHEDWTSTTIALRVIEKNPEKKQ